MATLTEENYLKAFYHLAQRKDSVTSSDLAEHLRVSKPTVNSMLKTLARKALVVYEPYKPPRLTDGGKKIAAQVVRKHRLTEMFLVEKMGFGWEEVHAIAEQIEHIDSPAFFTRMDELMGHPTTDPHGSPIPDREGRISPIDFKPLTEIAVHRKVRLRAIGNSSAALLEYLNRHRIQLGDTLEITRREPFDGSLEILVDGRSLVLSAEVGGCLMVG